MTISNEILDKCLQAIAEADGLLITAGAGMGIDSGLPDFRGPGGFWKLYPGLAKAGLQFEEIASPGSFRKDSRLAWGFYGHRLNLYRRTIPHQGFHYLKEIGDSLEKGAFVFTSNVDGQFHKAGFHADQVYEVHGSIHHLQCLDERCSAEIWSAVKFKPSVDDEACQLLSEPPECPRCGGVARPNILMFGDWGWRQERSRYQGEQLSAWLQTVKNPLVIEIGAGTDIATVRNFSDRYRNLIRINPREPDVKGPQAVGLAVGGLAALEAIYSAWQSAGRKQ